jgi:hypothetical protein
MLFDRHVTEDKTVDDGPILYLAGDERAVLPHLVSSYGLPVNGLCYDNQAWTSEVYDCKRGMQQQALLRELPRTLSGLAF